MSEGPHSSNRGDLEPVFDEKLLWIHATFNRFNIPHAFGGAISLNYHRDPRSTLDIDLNIFLPPDRAEDVLNALGSMFSVTEFNRHANEIASDSQTRVPWNATMVDLFFADMDFHESMAERIVFEDFGETQIPVLSIEDLLVCKSVFGRPKDWLDIEAVAQHRRGGLDVEYIYRWSAEFLGEESASLTRLRILLESQ